MGCGCGGSKARRNTAARRSQAARLATALRDSRESSPVETIAVPFNQLSKEDQKIMSNKEFVLIEYMHRSRGMHQVYGAITRRHYGYHKQGDRFLVHITDAQRQPEMFKLVIASKPAVVHQVPDAVLTKASAPSTPPPPPPPPTIGVSIPAPEMNLTYSDAAEELLEETGEVDLIDVGTIPSVSPAVERQLKANGIITYDAFMEAGVSGLMKLKYVGETKATLIYDWVAEHYGDDADAD